MNTINNSSKTCLIMIRYLYETKQDLIYSIDISRKLGITRQSICRTIKNLTKNNLIKLNKNKSITLTDDGIANSEKIYSKFLFFISLFNNQSKTKEIILESISLANIIKDDLYKIIYNKCK